MRVLTSVSCISIVTWPLYAGTLTFYRGMSAQCPPCHASQGVTGPDSQATNPSFNFQLKPVLLRIDIEATSFPSGHSCFSWS